MLEEEYDKRRVLPRHLRRQTVERPFSYEIRGAEVRDIPDIREIWVEGNPFTRTHKDYRVAIFNLFRKTAGYTEDIIIDGTGPTYSERRALVDRPPIPDSVPVVKPKAPEVPTVDMSKPSIIYGSQSEDTARKERPTPKAVMSEISTSSVRRRRTPKRRIVDLATGDISTSPNTLHTPGVVSPVDRSDAVTPEGNYRVSPTPRSPFLPPVILADSRTTKSSSTADTPRADCKAAKPFGPGVLDEPPRSWKAPQDWDSDAENYRLKIEALRDKVGDRYLSVLSEESWDAKNSSLEQSALHATSTLRAAHSPDPVQPVQGIHGIRALGQPISP